MIHLQIAFLTPFRAGDVPQADRHQHERRLAIGSAAGIERDSGHPVQQALVENLERNRGTLFSPLKLKLKLKKTGRDGQI